MRTRSNAVPVSRQSASRMVVRSTSRDTWKTTWRCVASEKFFDDYVADPTSMDLHVSGLLISCSPEFPAFGRSGGISGSVIQKRVRNSRQWKYVSQGTIVSVFRF